MNADTLIKALDEATRAPGALELQLAASGKQLQDLGLSWPGLDSLARLLDAMNKAAALLEGYGKYVVGTPVEVEDLRAYFKAAAVICREGAMASSLADLAEGRRLVDKDRRDRWYLLSGIFDEWARQVEGCKPSEAAAAPVPVGGQETAQNSTSMPTADTAPADTQTPANGAPGPTPVERFAQALNTHADELKEGRFIKGKPGAWKWIRRRGRDISKGSLCDLLKLLDIRDWSDWRSCAQAVGVTLNEHQRKRYASTQSKDYGDLRKILSR